MGQVVPIPRLGGMVRDARGAGRALRVSWHGEDGLVVLSLWDGPRCTGTVRIAAGDVPALVEALQLGIGPDPLPAPVTLLADPAATPPPAPTDAAPTALAVPADPPGPAGGATGSAGGATGRDGGATG